MNTVFEIFALIAFFNVDVTQLVKWVLSIINVTVSGWGAVALSYVGPVVTAIILYVLGVIPGLGFGSALLWGVGAALFSNGVYKARKEIKSAPLNG